jgi:hypothetical protein
LFISLLSHITNPRNPYHHHPYFNMVVSGYKEKEGEIRTAFVAVTTTKSALHTTNIKPWSTDCQGNLITRLYDKERIQTHVAAQQLVSKKTSIPVPKLLGFGENPDGTA